MRGDRLLHPVLRCDTDAEYFADGPLAQLVEHLTFNQGVAGPIPARPTIFSQDATTRFVQA